MNIILSPLYCIYFNSEIVMERITISLLGLSTPDILSILTNSPFED